MRKWEYKVVHRQRGLESNPQSTRAGNWDTNVVQSLPQWGDEGWELVTVIARSDLSGDSTAGFTTAELWVFKRPLEAA
jgi:hypothetical protein